MAFTSFASIEDLATRYAVEYRREEFVRPVATAFPPAFRAELDYTVRMVPFQRSEIHAREAVIYPVLKEAWRHYDAYLTLMSGEAVTADAGLREEVDYVICRRSPLGPLIPDRPFLLVGEAKRDDSSGGWVQALGGMLAARQLSGPAYTYYGLTTGGLGWRFGKLEADRFVQDPRVFGLLDDVLAGALHYVFAACRDQVLAQPPAAA